MSHDLIFDRKFFAELDDEDARVAAAARAGGCPACAGRLDQANFPRKPRGGVTAVAGEAVCRRRSLCCARAGCRKRLTPPSLVFLGRRVYLAITVVTAAWRSATLAVAPPRRTVRRWLVWFATRVPASRWFPPVRARLSPPFEAGEPLPGALVERLLPGRSVVGALVATLRLMAPLSTPTGAA
ncbi:MAG: hypothetical protein HS111_26240 [Kofleriaceae bacterium]|nr:hypothetical protein [Kofleriaceae bacterium]MBE7452254.1 hypothetical protein [Kofleriaceae bacterium]